MSSLRIGLLLTLSIGCGGPVSEPPPGGECGDGVRNRGELCDTRDTGGATCESEGMSPGSLGCSVTCDGFDYGRCGAPETCGNGALDAGEVCDGADLDGASCGSEGLGIGALACASNCLAFDTTPCCLPTTCEDAGATCGEIDDGCGSTVVCGAHGGGCEGWLTCGGAGTPNVCGALCRTPCPAGSTCSTNGVCVAADLSDLRLDVPTVQLSGSVTLDGSAPTEGTCTVGTPIAQVLLREQRFGSTATIPLLCGDGFAFPPTEVVPGTYTVSVRSTHEPSSDLPTTAVVTTRDLVVDRDLVDQVFDIATFAVAGTVQRNGGPFTEACAGLPVTMGVVQFEHESDHSTFESPIRCEPGFPFAVPAIVPGTYTVTVRADARSGLPVLPYVAATGLVLTASRADLVLDVQAIDVAGSITIRGAAPEQTASCAGRVATVTMLDAERGYVFRHDVACGSGFTFPRVTIFPGTFSVSMNADSTGESNLPGGTVRDAVVFDPALALATDRLDLALDLDVVEIGGVLTANGRPLADLGACTTSTAATQVIFENVDTHATFAARADCAGGFTFGPVRVQSGSYVARGVFFGSPATIPTSWWIDTPFDATTARADLVLDMRVVTIDGAITHNGATPMELAGCTPTTGVAVDLELASVDRQTSITATIACGTGFALGPRAFHPGNYQIVVRGRGPSVTDLPAARYAFDLSLTSDRSDLILDVPSVPVAGLVQWNGVTPTETAACTGDVATVVFYERDRDWRFTVPVPCGGGFRFGPATVIPGIYTVSVVRDGPTESNLPTAVAVVVDRLEVR